MLNNWNLLREARLGIMLHYDGSVRDTGAVEWLMHDVRCRVSYNWLVLDGGRMVKVVPQEARAWHAGVCRTSDPVRLPYHDANSALYGISIAATAGQVVAPEQLASVLSLCRGIFTDHGWPVSESWRIVSHHTEAWPRGRKPDVLGPDPAHPVLDIAVVRARFIEEAFG